MGGKIEIAFSPRKNYKDNLNVSRNIYDMYNTTHLGCSTIIFFITFLVVNSTYIVYIFVNIVFTTSAIFVQR